MKYLHKMNIVNYMEIKFNLLKDESINSEHPEYFDFYHKYFSPAIKEILKDKSCVHTIGLFGSWGSGKSTIIDSLKDDLGYPIFIFDTWKYQEDSLRRIFLLGLIDFIQKEKNIKVDEEKFEKIKDKINSKLYKTVYKKRAISENTNAVNWKAILKDNWKIFSGLLIILLLWGFVDWRFDFTENIKFLFNSLFSITIFSIFAISIIKPLFSKLFERFINDIFALIFPTIKNKEITEKEERLNSPEQFEKLFSEIIDSIKNNEKIIIVFDNIDRVQGDVAIKILSTIKTFLNPKECNKDIIFIVPCDDDALNNQIKQFYADDNNNFDPSEFLRKLFNLIIYTPEFIAVDLEKYTEKLIEQTGDVAKYLNNEDIKLVISSAFHNNPREIKQFINNFISIILVVSKTPVADEVLGSEKIGYFAKILVIKEKFPFAYKRLKNKWNKPESIVYKEDIDNHKRFVDFMNSTSRVKVDDAEPFIYFKEPVISSKLKNSKDLRGNLVDKNFTEFKKIASQETEVVALVDYIVDLLKKYKNSHEDILFNIFITQLLFFANSKIEINKKQYFEVCIETLDIKLWRFYFEIPVDIIFTFLLLHQKIDKTLISKIIVRYIAAIEQEELRKPNKRDLLVSILKNFVKHSKLLKKEEIINISNVIEQYFGKDIEVINLYKNYNQQRQFITAKTFEQFINTLNNNNLSNQLLTLVKYRKFIIEGALFKNLYNQITSITKKENSDSPTYREEKNILFQAVGKIFDLFKMQFNKIDVEDKREQVQYFIQAFNDISDHEDKSILINILKKYEDNLDGVEKDSIHELINQFFQHASHVSIEGILNDWKLSYTQKVLLEYMDSFFPRIIDDDKLLRVIYNIANEELKNKILVYVIENKIDSGIDFINSSKGNLPDKIKIVRFLLEKADKISQPESRLNIYEFVNQNLKINSDANIKNIAVSQIIFLLKSDNTNSSLTGLRFLQGTTFLSDEKKREIAKDVLDFLREPSRVIDENHVSCINSIVYLFDVLNSTLQNDFIYLLFELLRCENSIQIIELSLKSIKALKPSYKRHTKEYKDLMDRLRNWENKETNKVIVDNFIGIRPNKINKDEGLFWDEFDNLKKNMKE